MRFAGVLGMGLVGFVVEVFFLLGDAGVCGELCVVYIVRVVFGITGFLLRLVCFV